MQFNVKRVLEDQHFVHHAINNILMIQIFVIYAHHNARHVLKSQINVFRVFQILIDYQILRNVPVKIISFKNFQVIKTVLNVQINVLHVLEIIKTAQVFL